MKVENAYEMIKHWCKNGYTNYSQSYNANIYHVVINGVDIRLNGEVVINGGSTLQTEIDDEVVKKLEDAAMHGSIGDKFVYIEDDTMDEFIFREDLHITLDVVLSNIIKNGKFFRFIVDEFGIKSWSEI